MRVVVWSGTTRDGAVYAKVIRNARGEYEVQEGCCYAHSFTHPERLDEQASIAFAIESLAAYDD